jgi:hypothetical protein
MKQFIELSHREKSFKKMLIDINLIDYIIEDTEGLGSFLYLKGKSDPLQISESVSSVMYELKKIPKEQSQPIHVQLSWFRTR